VARVAAATDPELDAAAAQDVQRRELLGDPHRVRERELHDENHDLTKVRDGTGRWAVQGDARACERKQATNDLPPGRARATRFCVRRFGDRDVLWRLGVA
jgi:hypothetical protein